MCIRYVPAGEHFMTLQTTRALSFIVVTLLVVFWSAVANAQPAAHYVPGVEGLNAATLPPPGLYLRDYNFFYDADRLNDDTGHQIKAADLHTFVYCQVLRPVWIIDQKILGGYLGVDGFWPVVDEGVNVKTPMGKFNSSDFAFGDPFLGTTLSWHFPQWDWAIGLGEWFPAGAYSTQPTAKPGLGYFGSMATFGGTWHPDEEKTWSLSVLGRYEVNSQQRDTRLVPGDVLTLEWSLAKTIVKSVEIGPTGYYQQQTTVEHGEGATHARNGVFAAGPEISLAFMPNWFVSLRYCRELWAANRSEGNTEVLTVTYRF
jgi:hypothetical protein